MYDLLLDDENLITPEATAGALPPGAAPAVKTEAATGQPVVDTKAVNPAIGAPDVPTGAQQIGPYDHNDETDLATGEKIKQGVNLLLDYGLGKGAGGPEAAGGTGLVGGLPEWFKNARLRDQKVGKNSYTLKDEASWAPPEENRLGKGLAGMLAGMATAGSRVALEDKNRPLAMRMKDAKRVALGQGAAQLAGDWLDRKNLKYQDLLNAAKGESEVAKNWATGTGKGGKGGSDSSRMSALAAGISATERGISEDRMAHKLKVDEADKIINNDAASVKAKKLRRDIIASSGGYLTEKDVPFASYADLDKLQGRFSALIQERALQERHRYDLQWDLYKQQNALNSDVAKKWLGEQQDMANRRRDYWLPSNMFWQHGVPPKDTKTYEDVKTHVQQTDMILTALTEMSKIQQKLKEIGPFAEGGGAVLRVLGKRLGMEEAQRLVLLGEQWAAELRDVIREKNHFGVPQEWEQELMRSRVLSPGDLMAWLQGTNGFEALYALTKQNGKHWLRTKGGIGFEGEDPHTTVKGEREWSGQAPPLLNEIVVLGKDGKPDPLWERISQNGIQIMDELQKYGRRLTEPERAAQPPTSNKLSQDTTDNRPAGTTPRIEAAPAAPAGETGTPIFQEFKKQVERLQSGAEKWSKEQVDKWKEQAIRAGDKMLETLLNMPLDVQQRLFLSGSPITESADGQIHVGAPPARPLGDKPLEVTDPRDKPASAANAPTSQLPTKKQEEGKKASGYKIVDKDGKVLQEIPGTVSKEQADKIYKAGIKKMQDSKQSTDGIQLITQ
jgi:hypothetical protein